MSCKYLFYASATTVNLGLPSHLEQMGVVDRTYVSHGPATYHLASTSHGHVACENCGAIADVPAEAFLSLAETAKVLHGFAISPGHFAVPGRCANCQ